MRGQERPTTASRRTAHGARRTAHGARRTAHGARRGQAADPQLGDVHRQDRAGHGVLRPPPGPAAPAARRGERRRGPLPRVLRPARRPVPAHQQAPRGEYGTGAPPRRTGVGPTADGGPGHLTQPDRARPEHPDHPRC
ncbi:hypothetical protein FNV68_36250 [Streptomyces sp. S1D4-23]|nr:hypothetical protein FNV68_36250 [Streptomyces sp. S1D4-23]